MTALRHRLAERGIDRQLVLLLPALLCVLVLFVYPFAYGVGLSFQPSAGGVLGAYRSFFSDPYQRDTIATTLGLALPAALLNVAASVPIAYRMRGSGSSARRRRGKRALTTLLVVPITLGTVLTAQGLLNFLGPTGWFNRLLPGDAVRLTNNYWGVFFSLVITGFPFAFLLILSYLSGIDPTLEKAAATLGASWWQRFRRITLPLLAPGLATTFCLTFVLAFSVFPSAVLVGDPAGSTRVISIAAYRAGYEAYDYPLASAIAVVMGVIELAVVAVVLGLRSLFYTGSTGGKG
jgi:putative spermidine/putrescine transport system permease protein